MCPRQYIQANDEYMDTALWQKLINDVAKNNPQAIVLPFWRGESLLHPKFIEFLKYALGKSLSIHISTNGHLVTGEHAELLSQCEFVTFSIHTHAGFQNARKFLSLKKGDKPIIQISFVKGEESEKMLENIINTPDLNGFDSVRLYEEHTKDGIFGKSQSPLKFPRTFCPKLIDTLVIAYDGSVSRCNHIWETEKSINIRNICIKDAWNSKRLKEIRDHYPDTYCEPCDQWSGHTAGESWQLINGRVKHKKYGIAQEFSPVNPF